MQGILERTPKGVSVVPIRHHGGEPTLADVSLLAATARQQRADWISGVGGGSILDLAKAASALIHASHPPVHYHDGAAIDSAGITFVAVPTTAGTGAEATINSVLTNELTGTKRSIRHIGMMARVVILDPGLLSACPPQVIADSGLDALTQAIEAYSSRNSVWLSDALALKATGLIAGNLEAVYRDSQAPAAGDLLTGSYLGGVALSFARLGVVHGLAHPLGTLYHLPHGAVCAACLPVALEFNREAFGVKYKDLSHAVGGDLISTVRALMNRLGMTSPFSGKPLKEPETIIRETLASGSTQANPRPVTRPDVEHMLACLFA